MNENDETTLYKILRYIEGKEVSKEFLDSFSKDKDIQNKVIMLRHDLYSMKNVKTSSLFNRVDNKSSIVINNKSDVIFESLRLFTRITELNSRDNKPEKRSVYAYKNLELYIEKSSIFIIINEIEFSLIILKDGKNIVNIKGHQKTYLITLEKGDYLIKVDNSESSILIE